MFTHKYALISSEHPVYILLRFLVCLSGWKAPNLDKVFIFSVHIFYKQFLCQSVPQATKPKCRNIGTFIYWLLFKKEVWFLLWRLLWSMTIFFIFIFSTMIFHVNNFLIIVFVILVLMLIHIIIQNCNHSISRIITQNVSNLIHNYRYLNRLTLTLFSSDIISFFRSSALSYYINVTVSLMWHL